MTLKIEQEHDGMYVDQYAEYHEYSNGYQEEQPYVEKHCIIGDGCDGNCNGSCC